MLGNKEKRYLKSWRRCPRELVPRLCGNVGVQGLQECGKHPGPLLLGPPVAQEAYSREPVPFSPLAFCFDSCQQKRKVVCRALAPGSESRMEVGVKQTGYSQRSSTDTGGAQMPGLQIAGGPNTMPSFFECSFRIMWSNESVLKKT